MSKNHKKKFRSTPILTTPVQNCICKKPIMVISVDVVFQGVLSFEKG
jgi:hypothetical protein